MEDTRRTKPSKSTEQRYYELTANTGSTIGPQLILYINVTAFNLVFYVTPDCVTE